MEERRILHDKINLPDSPERITKFFAAVSAKHDLASVIVT